jgi:hypothetical protein
VEEDSVSLPAGAQERLRSGEQATAVPKQCTPFTDPCDSWLRVEREDLEELHYITGYSNVASILELGVLSHDLAEGVEHDSIALERVQAIREDTEVAGRRLHSYANLYLWGRNAMLYLRYRYEGRRDLCVLSVDPEVLDIPGVVVTDRNATKKWHRAAYVGSGGLEIVDRGLTFAERWDHPDPWERERRKTATQAEVLVPDQVPPEYVWGGVPA